MLQQPEIGQRRRSGYSNGMAHMMHKRTRTAWVFNKSKAAPQAPRRQARARQLRGASHRDGAAHWHRLRLGQLRGSHRTIRVVVHKRLHQVARRLGEGVERQRPSSSCGRPRGGSGTRRGGRSSWDNRTRVGRFIHLSTSKLAAEDKNPPRPLAIGVAHTGHCSITGLRWQATTRCRSNPESQ